MPEVIERQLSLFCETLPRRPYCGDDLSFGLKVRPIQQALERKHIQYNPPAMIHWLAYDIDKHSVAEALGGWDQVALPNLAVINPANQHSHLLYGLAAGVCTSTEARDGPRRLLAAIDEAYRHALGGDRGFTRLICKNPLHASWDVRVMRDDLYSMTELAEYVDLDAATERIRKTPKKHLSGVGRNCSMFDSLRSWAYKWVADYRGGSRGMDAWRNAVLARAVKTNTFLEPLASSEIRAIARSVADWTYKHYEGKMTASSLAKTGLTAESFSLLQSSLGQMGNAKRWGNNEEKRLEAARLSAAGLSAREIAGDLEVGHATVSRWLKDTVSSPIR